MLDGGNYVSPCTVQYEIRGTLVLGVTETTTELAPQPIPSLVAEFADLQLPFFVPRDRATFFYTAYKGQIFLVFRVWKQFQTLYK